MVNLFGASSAAAGPGRGFSLQPPRTFIQKIAAATFPPCVAI